MKRRGSGILCHITTLPSPYGIGDLGPAAYSFADFLYKSKQSYWQLLPLNPTNQRYADSPFSTMSSCAGNTVLISPDLLAADGLLTAAELQDRPPFPADKVDYQGVSRFKQALFRKAHARFKERGEEHDYQRFCSGHAEWLDDHALFTAISVRLGLIPLSEWPRELSDPRSPEVQRLREELSDDVERERFLQFIYYKQWNALRHYCHGKGIMMIGGFPMFMNYDSVDIWVYPQYFKVDERRKPYVVAGSPPDAFSADGQLFNCAVYNWEALQQDNFSWWVRRFHYLFKMYDFVRIDHFRGLISYWEVPAGAPNALKGKWEPAMVHDFLNAILVHFPTLPVIAEDLGVITAEVREAMEAYGIPGIKVLLLAFQKGAYEPSYLPHNHNHNCVVYTGTHDTNTVMGWFDSPDNEVDKELLFDYLGREVETEVNWEFIRMAMMSVAHTCIIQMQDLLGSGEETRMNTPGQALGNWQWRMPQMDLTGRIARLAGMTASYGRAANPGKELLPDAKK